MPGRKAYRDLVEDAAAASFSHIPPDFVVPMGLRGCEQLTPRFLFLHDVWALFRRRIGEKITSTISTAWHFTTKSFMQAGPAPAPV